ncbi:hypothetical protein ACRE_020740 [Hapsidospora chrysogenum ATCC 11550]|uniref:Uncharacterized protein n=1 Tax=Hapsidospora chrysogenum (strain ATCC 11550 / CBS 779.69 / DSM 880 / IAM 14645 / JCM 23072 / IMI 49137) TaxID=857340 RepID=A0A086TCF2_HAPC1|nr:hypothetical protein ACRE_020740 [Hapsidospora chrysogenum ATCC 11550]
MATTLGSASDAFLPTGGFDTDHSFQAGTGTGTGTGPHYNSSNHPHPAANRSHSSNGRYSNSNNLPSILSPLPQLPTGFPPISNNPSPPGQNPKPHRRHQQYRSRLSPIPQNGTDNTPSYQPTPPGAELLYRSVSADATSLPSLHPPNHLVQRLAHQNTLIREAWEAERNYLEANRRRAEEVYQEERLIMEEVREAWENEKAVLLRESQILKERIHRLEGENAALRALSPQGGAHAPAGVMSPLSSQRGSSAAVSSHSGTAGQPPSQRPSLQGMPPSVGGDPLPPGLDGASRRPHHWGLGSAKTSPTSQPESSPFIPLDPRMQPQTRNPKDFLARPSTDREESVPVIDVQEVDPKLDGIQLKATAVQRFTFGESNKSSPATSPPAAAGAAQAEPRQGVKRLSSKDQTVQVLQAEESRRLTMYAGHTPNHSLSLFPTMSLAGSTRDTTTQDDETEPSPGVPSPPPEEAEESHQHRTAEPAKERKTHRAQDQPEAHEDEVDHPEEQFNPADDKKLQGPLMVRNMPAHDDIFFAKVNEVLERSRGEDALPAVVRSPIDESGPSGTSQKPPRQQDATAAPAAGEDAAPPGGIEDAGEDVDDERGVEGDIPLKLRHTNNFGAPLGMVA